MLKAAYLASVRALRPVAVSTGLLGALERSPARAARWARSLFSIYDVGDMARLDLPWWTFAAIERVDAWLSARPRPIRAFEYGSGASTLWLARRCAEVVTVEHDIGFAAVAAPLFAPQSNIRLHVVPPAIASGREGEARSLRRGHENLAFDDYVAALQREPGDFDLIVVDGRARNACLAAALPRLAPSGLVVFDNSDRAEYRPALERCALPVERLRGFAPALPYRSETSLLGMSPT